MFHYHDHLSLHSIHSLKTRRASFFLGRRSFSFTSFASAFGASRCSRCSQRCSRGTSRCSQRCSRGASRCSQRCSRGTSRCSQRCSRGASRCSQRCSRGASRCASRLLASAWQRCSLRRSWRLKVWTEALGDQKPLESLEARQASSCLEKLHGTRGLDAQG